MGIYEGSAIDAMAPGEGIYGEKGIYEPYSAATAGRGDSATASSCGSSRRRSTRSMRSR
jgi:hypothetical protein